MKHWNYIFLFFIVSCAGLKHSAESDQATAVFVGLKNGDLIYQGEITEASNHTAFSLFDIATPKPNRLLISSKGGEIGAGLALGRWVKTQNLDVEVTVVCASSCANYVFLAGNKKFLHKDSILMWHGSAWQPIWDIAEESQVSFKKYLTDIRNKESQFYADIGVDNIITIYGQSRINLWDKINLLFGKGPVGYDYSLVDLAKFGVNNIILVENEWEWRKYQPLKAQSVKRVIVSDDFEFARYRFER